LKKPWMATAPRAREPLRSAREGWTQAMREQRKHRRPAGRIDRVALRARAG
jgi:hypothetical protein